MGVFKNTTKCTDTEYTHTSVIVGYGETVTTDGGVEKYWEIINSYGDQWGSQGYIKLARDVGWTNGQNGILKKPAWNVPKVKINEQGEYSSS